MELIHLKVQVRLADIIDALECISMDNRTFVDLKTSEVVYVMNEYIDKADEGETYDSMAKWEQEMMTLALQIVDHEYDYIEIDSQYVDEYNMMERFCYTITDTTQQAELLYALRGKGAFRRFKDLVYQFDLADNWYDYPDRRYEDCAKGFCHRHNLKYVEDDHVK